MNEVSITINGVMYNPVEGLYCSACAFDKECEYYGANLCWMLGVPDCGFKKSEKV